MTSIGEGTEGTWRVTDGGQKGDSHMEGTGDRLGDQGGGQMGDNRVMAIGEGTEGTWRVTDGGQQGDSHRGGDKEGTPIGGGHP